MSKCANCNKVRECVYCCPNTNCKNVYCSEECVEGAGCVLDYITAGVEIYKYCKECQNNGS